MDYKNFGEEKWISQTENKMAYSYLLLILKCRDLYLGNHFQELRGLFEILFTVEFSIVILNAGLMLQKRGSNVF